MSEQILERCSVCGEPIRALMPMMNGEMHEVSILCRCKREVYEAEEQARKDRERANSIRTAKKALIADERLRAASFEDYEITDENRTAYKAARAFVDGFDKIREPGKDRRRGLLFFGQPGTGKSFTAACILNELIERGRSGLITSIPRLIDQFQNFEVDSSQLLRDIERVDILVIDDLGVEGNTTFRLEKAFEIIDTRYGADKPTIFTTNLFIDEIESASDIRYQRIYDRVLGMCYPVQITGKSHRR